MAVLTAPSTQDWLLEIELEPEREPALEEVIEFRDRVWAAQGALRRVGERWIVALIVAAGDHAQAAEHGRATVRGLGCSFARFAGLEASPVG